MRDINHLPGKGEREDVLECLLSDAAGVEAADGFEFWCADLGFDEDSRKVERIYRQSVGQTEKLRRFLGGDYNDYLWETER